MRLGLCSKARAHDPPAISTQQMAFALGAKLKRAMVVSKVVSFNCIFDLICAWLDVGFCYYPG